MKKILSLLTAFIIIQILVDFAMTALLPLLMAYSMIGETAHEWLGATMIVLFVVVGYYSSKLFAPRGHRKG